MVNEKHFNGFDRVAGVYDKLAQLVFGRSIVEAQLYFLNKIPAGATVLILGGGTGWLLAELLLLRPDSKIWYIEASQKMIALTRKKISDQFDVHFIYGTEQSIPKGLKFDTVITNFYLDLFSQGDLLEIIPFITLSLKREGLWLATDFINTEKWWQRIMLSIMYRFFRVISCLKTNKLPEWQKVLQRSGLSETQSKLFFGGFIKTAIYRIKA